MDWPTLLTSPPQVVPGGMERSKTLSFAAIFGDEPPPANEDTFRRFDLLAAKIKTGKNLAKLLVVSDTLGVAVYITVENPTSTQNAKGLLHKLFEHFGEQVRKRLDQTVHMLNARDNERIQKMVGPEIAHVQGCVRCQGWVCACASCATKLPLPTPPDEVCLRERHCVCLLCAPEVTARQIRRRSKKKSKTASLRDTAEGALVLDWGCAHTVSTGELEVAACIRKQACSCRRCAPDPGAAGLKRPSKQNLREWFAVKEAADERERTQMLALPMVAAYDSRGRESPAGLALTAGTQALSIARNSFVISHLRFAQLLEAHESRDRESPAGLGLTAGTDALAVEMPAARAPRRLVGRAQALEAAREQLDQERKAAEASRKEAEGRVHELSARLEVDCTLSVQDQLAKLSLNAKAWKPLEEEGASILKSLREREMLEEETIPELIDALTTELQAVRQQEESAVKQRCALVYMDYMWQLPLYMVEFMHEHDKEGLILDRARPLVQEELRQLDELIENAEGRSNKAQRLRKEIVAKTTGAAVELVSQGVLPPYDKTKQERSRFVQRVHKVLTGMIATVPKPGKRLKKGEECQEVKDCLGGIEKVCISCQAHLSHAISPVHWDQKTGRTVEKMPFATKRTLLENHIASLVAEREWLAAEPAGKPEKDIWRDEEALEKGTQQGAASLRDLDYFASLSDASISYMRRASMRSEHWSTDPMSLEADVKRIEDKKSSRLRSASEARKETEQRIHSMKTRLGELRCGKVPRKTSPAAGAKHEKLQAIDEEIAKYREEAKTATNAKLPFRYTDDHTSEFDSTVDALSFCSEMCLDAYLLSPVCPTCGECVPADVNDPSVRAVIDARIAELTAEFEKHGEALHLALDKFRAAPEEHRSEVEAASRKMLDLATSLRAWTGAPNISNTIRCSSVQQHMSKVASEAEARQRRQRWQKQGRVERDSTLPAQSTDTVILDEDLKEKLGILRERSRQLQLVDAPKICEEHLIPMTDRDPRRRAQLSLLTERPQV